MTIQEKQDKRVKGMSRGVSKVYAAEDVIHFDTYHVCILDNRKDLFKMMLCILSDMKQ